MRVNRLRKMVARGGMIGLAGLALLGAYVLARTIYSRPWLRWTVVVAGVLLVALVLGDPMRCGTSVRVMEQHALQVNGAALGSDIQLIDLGTHGEGVVVTGVSAKGDVSGVAILGEKEWHAVVWQGGKMRDLGTLGGTRSMATGIHESGGVTGLSETGSGYLNGFRWQGRMTKLPSLDGGVSIGAAINGKGDVVGTSTDKGEKIVACLWHNGRPKSLGIPSGYAYSFGQAINDSGQVAGDCYPKDVDRVRAFLWDGGRAKELPTLGGPHSSVMALGRSGHVVGASVASGTEDWTACLWDKGKAHDLGRLPGSEWSFASGVTSRGEVVGSSGSGCGAPRACVWGRGRILDLNSLLPAGSGWTLLTAAGVNDKGVVAGTALYRDRLHAYLLVPKRGSSVLDSEDAMDLGVSAEFGPADHDLALTTGSGPLCRFLEGLPSLTASPVRFMDCRHSKPFMLAPGQPFGTSFGRRQFFDPGSGHTNGRVGRGGPGEVSALGEP